ncbi:MAG: hypothetical protein K8R77_05500 [Anaerolineaceae bacterium]|nr:hypothetical protein [Anaerolineaceae bacterium]
MFSPADGKTTSRHFTGQEQQYAHHHDQINDTLQAYLNGILVDHHEKPH